MPDTEHEISPLHPGILFRRTRLGTDIEQIVIDMGEALDLGAFEGAWRRLAARHEIRRTSFAWEDIPEPRQRLHDAFVAPFEPHDWVGFDSAVPARESVQAGNRFGRLISCDLGLTLRVSLNDLLFSAHVAQW